MEGLVWVYAAGEAPFGKLSDIDAPVGRFAVVDPTLGLFEAFAQVALRQSYGFPHIPEELRQLLILGCMLCLGHSGIYQTLLA